MSRLKNLLGLLRRPRPRVGATPAEVAFAENKWRLLRYRPRPEGLAHRTPVLMVPSLINRHYVLDLMPGKSFAEYLVGQGFEVYCIDWGTPGPEDRFVTFDDLVDGALGRALRKVSEHAPGQQAHVLGYCMGGTLAAIHGAVHPRHLASLVALAAPVKFHDQSLLSVWTRTPGFDVDALVDATGNVPWPLLQASFHLLRPTLNLQKAVTLLDRAWNDEFLDGFLAIETWGNDNVSLPGEFYRRYIGELYRQDLLLEGRFRLGGQPVDLKRLTCPTLAVTFEHDNIVPAASAAVLLEACGASVREHLHLNGGHVGAVISKHAAKTLWPKLAAFFAAQEVVTVAPVTSPEPRPELTSPPEAPPAPRPKARRKAGASARRREP
jgi:polyhydroxyalkanoate synthase subunit PhaC